MHCFVFTDTDLYSLTKGKSYLANQRWRRSTCFFFLSCISLFRIAFTHHNHDTYWNGIFNTAQQKFFTNIGQGHNLCKPKTFIT